MATAAPLTPMPRSRARRRFPRLPLSLSVVPWLLVGCSQAPPPVDPTALIPPATPTAPTAKDDKTKEEKTKDASAGVGLEPLATPQQVLSSVELGRRDPFGRLIPAFPVLVGPDGKPLPAAAMAAARAAAAAQAGAAGMHEGAPTAAAAAARGGAGRVPPAFQPPLQLPRGFSISGVIRSGGVSEAVVNYGALSGSLRPGDRGGRTTDLLPSGWSVAAIDVNRGVLTLQKGGQRVTAEL